MPNIVYVPQGNCARFNNITKTKGISGLYTDGFTSCSIIVCIGENKITLSHFDSLTLPEKIKSEVAWINDSSTSVGKLIIISRLGIGDPIKDQLLKHFKSFDSLKKFEITQKNINELHDGVYVSLEPGNQVDIHPQVKTFPIGERPNGLIHHPQEQEFLAVRKIEQIIGINAKRITKKIRTQVFTIFDGEQWEKLGENELTIDESHPATREEMQFVAQGKSLIDIAGRLTGIARSTSKVVTSFEDPESMGRSVAFYMEGYLNKYDYELLLKNNLHDLLTDEMYTKMKKSEEDNRFVNDIIELIKKPSDIFPEVEELLLKYKKETSETVFKKNIVTECNRFIKNYQERKYYANIKKPSINNSMNLNQTTTTTETLPNKIDPKSNISGDKDFLNKQQQYYNGNSEELQQESVENLSKKFLEMENDHSRKQQLPESEPYNPALLLNQFQQQQQLQPSNKKKKKKKKRSNTTN